ncbi:DUF2201 family putative metallopeptidase [Aliidiomarina quisquiliarum]|uniref:vWA domain-containing protein n=1 Tax=Aliidiomarina quisquiliarum TaxID=2938947 RepID=UPI00208F8D74|nr:VWA-like domain-containing protein [Aliidiomarina quisquiliarum]
MNNQLEQQQLAKQQAKLVKQLHEDRSYLLLTQPFTAGLALRLEIEAVTDLQIPTAATDGQKIYFNVDFANAINDQTRRFVMCHEVWHCVMGHLTRRQGRNPQLWNIAVDYEVNAICQQLLHYIPKGALFDAALKGKSAEEIYHLLADGSLKASSSQGVLDNHMEMSVTTVYKWQEHIKTAMDTSNHYGLLPSNIRRAIQAVYSPPLPWKHLLQRFVQRQLTGERQWFPPSRRHIYRGLYLPRQRGESIELTIALDNSGSCTREASVFLGQLKVLLGAFAHYEVTLIQCDTVIQSVNIITPMNPLQEKHFNFSGGGGTDFQAVFDYIKQHPTPGLVFFTDGCVRLNNTPPAVPVLWVLTSNGQTSMPWGEVTRLEKSRSSTPWQA